jgi:hypothetical protein
MSFLLTRKFRIRNKVHRKKGRRGVMVTTQTNQPAISDETLKEMTKFFMKTSIPRILVALERGELILENGNLVRVKEVSANDASKCI